MDPDFNGSPTLYRSEETLSDNESNSPLLGNAAEGITPVCQADGQFPHRPDQSIDVGPRLPDGYLDAPVVRRDESLGVQSRLSEGSLDIRSRLQSQAPNSDPSPSSHLPHFPQGLDNARPSSLGDIGANFQLAQQRDEGYDLEFIFPSGTENKYDCPICLLVLREPYQTGCGHRFCQVCIKRWLR